MIAAVCARLGRLAGELDRLDLEGCYAQAWHGLYNRLLAGERIANPVGWLVVVTERRAREELRARRKVVIVEEELDGRGAQSHRDQEGALESRRKLREVFQGIALSLNPLERRAVALCYLQGLSRAEAARRLGISERRLRRVLEGKDGKGGATRKLGEVVALVAADRFCESHRSLMRAFAFGLLDPAGNRYQVAVSHQRSCPACSAYVRALRGLAAFLPPPLPFGVAALWGGGLSWRAAGCGGCAAGQGAAQIGLAGIGAGAMKAATAALLVGVGATTATLGVGAIPSSRPPRRSGAEAALVRPPAPPPAKPAAPPQPPVAIESRPRPVPSPRSPRRDGPQTAVAAAASRRLAVATATEFGFEGEGGRSQGGSGERPVPPPPRAHAAAAAHAGAAAREFGFEGSP